MHSGFVTAGGRRLEYQLIPAHQINRPTLVLLHEGLGLGGHVARLSRRAWRMPPAAVPWCIRATATASPTCSKQPFGTDYMHREGRDNLPRLLAALEIENPVLVGHSDGASIALLHAGAGHPVAGLVVMAPHCFVEDISIRSIAAAKVAFETTDLPAKLGRITAMSIARSGAGTISGCIRISAPGTSRIACRRSAAPSWRSRARTTNTAPWRRSRRSPRARNSRRVSNCSSWPIAGTRRTRTRPWR
jgi:pimeloyl-ACP methyl ester carboxylesterase